MVRWTHVKHTDSSLRSPEAAAFAAQLRSERVAAGLSIAELAKASGVRQQTIRACEDGQQNLDTYQLGQVCRALRVTIRTFALRAEERLRTI